MRCVTREEYAARAKMLGSIGDRLPAHHAVDRDVGVGHTERTTKIFEATFISEAIPNVFDWMRRIAHRVDDEESRLIRLLDAEEAAQRAIANQNDA